MNRRSESPPAPQPEDKVDEQVWESFPASDPPAFMYPGGPCGPEKPKAGKAKRGKK